MGLGFGPFVFLVEELLDDEGHAAEGCLGFVEADEVALVESLEVVDVGLEIVLGQLHGHHFLHPPRTIRII